MNISQLRTFVEVYKRRNVSRAAEALHISQPAVTLHLKKLEKEFGAALFQRRGFQFLPTRCADILYSHARHILNQLETAKNEICFEREGVSGVLRVSASSTPGEYLVPEMISAFVKKFPRVHVELFVTDSEAVMRCLQKQQCDFGFTGARAPKSKFLFHKIAEDEIVLACPEHFKGGRHGSITLGELNGLPFVMREEGSGTMKSVRDLLRRHRLYLPPHRVTAVIESSHAQLSAVEAGLGVGFVSSLAVQRNNLRGRIRVLRLRGIRLIRPLYMVHAREKSRGKLCAEFARFAVSFAESAKKKSKA